MSPFVELGSVELFPLEVVIASQRHCVTKSHGWGQTEGEVTKTVDVWKVGKEKVERVLLL